LIASLYYIFSRREETIWCWWHGGLDQIVVSPQVGGRIAKLLVEEGTPVKQGDLIAVLDPAELEAQERAAAATISSLRSKVSESQFTRVRRRVRLPAMWRMRRRVSIVRSQLAQAEAMLARVESDSRRIVGLARAGVASEMEKVQAEQNLKAQQASVQALKDQVRARKPILTQRLPARIRLARRKAQSLPRGHNLLMLRHS